MEQLAPKRTVPGRGRGRGRVTDHAAARAQTRDYLATRRGQLKRSVDDGTDPGSATRTFDGTHWRSLPSAAELMPRQRELSLPGSRAQAAADAVLSDRLARACPVILRRYAEPHPPMNPLRHCNATRRLIGVALLALLLGQWAVLAHSIAHARTPAPAAVSADTDHAWGHPAGTPACHLVDHLLAGQAPGGEPASVAFVPPAEMGLAVPASSIGPRPAPRAYQARGPPRA